MKNIIKIFSFVSVLFLSVSCSNLSTDLEVENLENPNDKILTSDPVALTATAGTIMQNWFLTVHEYDGPGLALITMSDAVTMSYGNAGMRDLSSEPRVAFNNTSSYSNQIITSKYFNSLYSVLSDSNTLALAVKNGTKFENSKQIEMTAKLGQALSIGYLALVFDKVWLSDENGVVGEGASDYKVAMTFALTKLDEAIAIANANNISFPENWLPGGGGTATKLKQFMNSMGARMLVGNVRNSTQKAAIDWTKVLAYANAGVTSDFEIYMDDTTWYSYAPHTYAIYGGWGRVDMRIINMMDPNTPAYWTDTYTQPNPSTSADARLLTDYQFLPSNTFAVARGKYHFSSYRYKRQDSYITNWTENIVELSKAENDMFKAEALAHKNDLAGAAAVINAGTRVTRGNLAPVAADLAAIKSAIHYERMVEFAYTGMGITFFEMRKENLLQKGTLLHFPIPGKALEAIPAANYTYGGTDGVAGEDYSNTGWR
ncbi:MAG: hypothetical protein KA278_07165 [Flavobacterium sp.]|nr:hypothetical protein [Flavobacterium sp.]